MFKGTKENLEAADKFYGDQDKNGDGSFDRVSYLFFISFSLSIDLRDQSLFYSLGEGMGVGDGGGGWVEGFGDNMASRVNGV